MALVICCVLLTDRSRRRMSMRLAIDDYAVAAFASARGATFGASLTAGAGFSPVSLTKRSLYSLIAAASASSVAFSSLPVETMAERISFFEDLRNSDRKSVV